MRVVGRNRKDEVGILSGGGGSGRGRENSKGWRCKWGLVESVGKLCEGVEYR